MRVIKLLLVSDWEFNFKKSFEIRLQILLLQSRNERNAFVAQLDRASHYG
jgi:hypothetical protein